MSTDSFPSSDAPDRFDPQVLPQQESAERQGASSEASLPSDIERLDRHIQQREAELAFESFAIGWVKAKMAKKRFCWKMPLPSCKSSAVYFGAIGAREKDVVLRALQAEEADLGLARLAVSIRKYVDDEDKSKEFQLLPIHKIGFDSSRYRTPIPQLIEWLTERLTSYGVWYEICELFEVFQTWLDRLHSELACGTLLVDRPALRSCIAARLDAAPVKIKELYFQFEELRKFYLDSALLALTSAASKVIGDGLRSIYDRLYPSAELAPIDKLRKLRELKAAEWTSKNTEKQD